MVSMSQDVEYTVRVQLEGTLDGDKKGDEAIE